MNPTGRVASADSRSSKTIFVHDLAHGSTRRISASSTGAQANGSSRRPSISGDGRFIAFESTASNLVAGDDGAQDVFVHDRIDGSTRRLSEGSRMVRVPSLSANGRFVAFSSTAPYPSTGDWFFEHVFVYDLVEASLRQVDGITDDKDLGPAYFPRLSADGSTVAFISTSGRLVEGDTNGRADVFVAPLD